MARTFEAERTACAKSWVPEQNVYLRKMQCGWSTECMVRNIQG